MNIEKLLVAVQVTSKAIATYAQYGADNPQSVTKAQIPQLDAILDELVLIGKSLDAIVKNKCEMAASMDIIIDHMTGFIITTTDINADMATAILAGFKDINTA